MDIVSRYGLSDSKGKSIPLNLSMKLFNDIGNSLDTNKFECIALIGSLMYLVVCTCAVGALARYSANPMAEHWDVVVCVSCHTHHSYSWRCWTGSSPHPVQHPSAMP